MPGVGETGPLPVSGESPNVQVCATMLVLSLFSSRGQVKKLTRLHELLLFCRIQTDLFVGQVAGRVRSPRISEKGVGPDSQASAAGIKVPA